MGNTPTGGLQWTPITPAVPPKDQQGAPSGTSLTWTAVDNPPAAVTPPPATGAPTKEPGAIASALGEVGDTGAKVATGFVKGLGDTVSGVSHLINKIPVVGETLAPKEGITSLDQRDVADGTAEMAGKGLEGIAEFATGDEALEGLSKASKLVALAKKYPAIAETLNMASKNKMLEKIITTGGKQAAVGAAQGVVKGAQKDNATKEGLIEGATAGVAGGLTEAAPAIFNWMAKQTGVGGLNATEAFVKAGRPSTSEGKKFVAALDGTKDILRTIPNSAVKDVGDFEDAVHNTANKLWETQVQPAIDANENYILDLAPVRDQVQTVVNGTMKRHFPKEAAAIEEFANGFGKSTIGEANEDLKVFNARLKNYYKLNSIDAAAAEKNAGNVAMLESAADGLRNQIYSAIDTQEGLAAGTTAKLRQQYGQLRDIERVFGKRAVVVDRHAPLNMTQILGLTLGAGRIMAGDMSGAVEIGVPYIVKGRGGTKSLIKQGLNDLREQAGTPAIGDRLQNAAGTASKAAPNLVAQSLHESRSNFRTCVADFP